MRRPTLLALGFSLAASLLGACGGSAATTAKPSNAPPINRCEPPHDQAPVEVFLAVGRDGKHSPLCPGAHVAQDDSLWVEVNLEYASYVRLVFVAPNGDAGELLRQDEADQTRTAIFLAPKGLLAHAAGDAQLVVVASREPLSEVDPMMGGVIDAIRDSGSLVERDGTVRPPPEGTPRGESVSLDFAPKGLHCEFDDKGMAMLLIPLRAAP